MTETNLCACAHFLPTAPLSPPYLLPVILPGNDFVPSLYTHVHSGPQSCHRSLRLLSILVFSPNAIRMFDINTLLIVILLVVKTHKTNFPNLLVHHSRQLFILR